MHLDVQLLRRCLGFNDGNVEGIVCQEPQARHATFELIQEVDGRKESLV
jgi:hypothetical protein